MFERACASDVSGLLHWRISLKMPESNAECFWYNYIIINCLLTIFVHSYYGQPIYFTDVSKWCESLTDWSIPLMAHRPTASVVQRAKEIAKIKNG